jgi:adenosylcobinamide kinase / adenosylcobinamide-phosphate guanylyltransferase
MRSRGVRTHLMFVVGGASSGKSDVALRLASQGVGRTAARAFVATGESLDEEMAMKIAKHRQSRSSVWDTAEVPLELSAWFKQCARKYRVIVVDCLTMWLSNHCARGTKDREIIEQTNMLLGAIRQSGARVVLVSNELGLGLVPIDAHSRRFRELAGTVNRLVAKAADQAYFVVSGIPLSLKKAGR